MNETTTTESKTQANDTQDKGMANTGSAGAEGGQESTSPGGSGLGLTRLARYVLRPEINIINHVWGATS